ncbi:glycerophosphodiester phosphodiesterase family protein [Roseisalinus antarcticus]|uniref:Glycerophosphoryl diester phosphodiesterase n=1 Tax=Roseisalinus antarcticus TaxID=254357 RepID=A0A1Y5T8F9_9RHOB|nr:glycerophosphodiester phosphodiesterase family protein [Roseisalinus antarcticus]SLN58029.1 Glycerophosphoryl diester phosphodiesterase [Roseisalinus antarcticus]
MRLDPAFLAGPLAHRALHDITQGRPENSRAAVAAAIAAGYGIEIDVQTSADGVAMVFHDVDLARLTGASGAIAQQTARTLGATRLKRSEEGIPTLAEILAQVAGRVPVLVEIKDQDGAMGPNVGTLEQAVAETLRGYTGPVAVMSFNPHSVAAMARAAPEVPRGLTTCAFRRPSWPTVPERTRHRLREIPDFADVGACFVSHDAQDLGRPRLAELRTRGVAVLCWTIRSPDAEAAARRHADTVTFEGYLPPPGPLGLSGARPLDPDRPRPT